MHPRASGTHPRRKMVTRPRTPRSTRGTPGSGPVPRGEPPMPVLMDEIHKVSSEEVALQGQVILGDAYKCIAVDEDGIVWTGERNGGVWLRDQHTAEVLTDGIVYEGGKANFVSAINYIPTVRQVWAGYSDGIIRVFSATGSKDMLSETRHHSGVVNCIHPSGPFVITGGQDWKLYKWSPTRTVPRQMSLLSGHSNAIRCVASDFKRGYLYSGSDDMTIRSWSTSGQVCAVLKGHTSSVLSLCLPQTSNMLWSGSEDAAILVWNLDTNELVTKLSSPALHQAPVTQALYMHEDGRVWTTDKQGVMLIWDPCNFTVVQKLSPSDTGNWQRNAILTAAILPKISTCRVWTCSADGAVRIWTSPCLTEPETVAKLEKEIQLLSAQQEKDMNNVIKRHSEETLALLQSQQQASPEVVQLREELAYREAELEELKKRGCGMDNAQLRSFLQAKKKEMDQRLMDECNARKLLEAELETLKASVQQRRSEVHDIKVSPPVTPKRDVSSVHTPHEAVTGLADELASKESQLSNILMELTTSEEKRIQLEVELERVKLALSQSTRQLQLAAHDAETTQGVLTKHESLLEENAELKQELVMCKAQVRDWEEQVGKLRDSALRESDTSEKLRAASLRESDVNEQLQAAVMREADTNDRLKTAMQREDEANTRVRELEAMMRTREVECADLERLLGAEKARGKETEERLHELTLLNEDLKKATATLQIENSDLRVATSDNESTSRSLQSVTAALNAEVAAHDKLKTAYAALEADMRSITSNNAAMEATISSLRNETSNIHHLHRENEDMRVMLQARTQQGNSLVSKISELESMLQAEKSAHEACIMHNTTLGGEITSLNAQLQEVTKQLSLLMGENERYADVKRELENTIKSLHSESELMKGPWAQLQKVLAESQSTLTTVQSQFRHDIAILEAELRERDILLGEQKRALIEKDSLIAIQKGQLSALLTGSHYPVMDQPEQ